MLTPTAASNFNVTGAEKSVKRNFTMLNLHELMIDCAKKNLMFLVFCCLPMACVFHYEKHNITL